MTHPCRMKFHPRKTRKTHGLAGIYQSPPIKKAHKQPGLSTQGFLGDSNAETNGKTSEKPRRMAFQRCNLLTCIHLKGETNAGGRMSVTYAATPLKFNLSSQFEKWWFEDHFPF